MATDENKRSVTVVLDPDVIEGFKDEARTERLSFSAVINRALTETLVRKRQKGEAA